MRTTVAVVLALALALVLWPWPAAQGQSVESLKRQVVIQEQVAGKRIASSTKFAVIVRNARYVNGGRSQDSAFVYAESQPGKPTRVAIIGSRGYALFPEEVQSWDDEADPNTVRPAFIGYPWRETTYRTLERGAKCGGPGQWCMWTGHYQVDLTPELVRELLADNTQTKLQVGLGAPSTTWNIPKDHLVATLDALGVLGEFR
jgi:hypothetical protein